MGVQKILMAESSDIYHDGRVLKEAKALITAGYKVEIFGFRNLSTIQKKYPFKIISLPLISKKHRKLRNTTICLNILIINIRILLKKADVYHSHNTMFLFGMYLASKIYGGKLIYDSHEVQSELNFLAKKLESLFIQKTDAIINVSKGRAEHQAKIFSISVEKIIVVSNYPEIPEKLSPIIQKNQNEISFVFSGGFDLYDNKLDNFIRVLKEFDNCKFYLLAFGYGNSKEILDQLINENELKDKVIFLKLVEPNNVISVIEKYDIAVNLLSNPRNLISYKYHGINKMYEYLLAGLPILSSNMPSFVEEFEQNKVGKSVNPNDLESIREGIRFFINNFNNIAPMKLKARELAINNYNWDNQARKLIELYNKL